MPVTRHKSSRRRSARRTALRIETLDRREVFSGLGFGSATDPNDQLSEAVDLGEVSTELTRTGVIDDGYDVDMYRFAARAGDTIDIEAAPSSGSNVSTRVRLFGEDFGRENQPLGNGIGSLRFRVSKSGTFYVGVSELGNEFYNPITGNADFNDPSPTSGTYRLSIKAPARINPQPPAPPLEEPGDDHNSDSNPDDSNSTSDDPNQCQPRHNCDLPEDVNGDGVVSPIDALQVINDLNSAGARILAAGSGPDIDVSADGSVSPIDALLVINYLNGRSGGHSSGSAANDPGNTEPLNDDAREPADPGNTRGGCALSHVGELLGAACPSTPTAPRPDEPVTRIPREPSTPGSSSDGCALSRIGQLRGASCSSSNNGPSNSGSTSQPRSGGATALSRIGQLLSQSSTASAAYTSSVDQALVELLAPASRVQPAD